MGSFPKRESRNQLLIELPDFAGGIYKREIPTGEIEDRDVGRHARFQ
jgi:hypothetical protein